MNYISIDGGRNWYDRKDAERIGNLLQLAGRWGVAVDALDNLDHKTRDKACWIAPCSAGQYLREYMRLYKRDITLDIAPSASCINAEIAESCINWTPTQLKAALNDYVAEERGSNPSAWHNGVYRYALDLISEHIDALAEALRTSWAEDEKWMDIYNRATSALLSGANSWSEYSYGGCALIYDNDIAGRICTPAEMRKKRRGELQPNSCETWLDVQARALRLAARWISRRIASIVTGRL